MMLLPNAHRVSVLALDAAGQKTRYTRFVAAGSLAFGGAPAAPVSGKSPEGEARLPDLAVRQGGAPAIVLEGPTPRPWVTALPEVLVPFLVNDPDGDVTSVSVNGVIVSSKGGPFGVRVRPSGAPLMLVAEDRAGHRTATEVLLVYDSEAPEVRLENPKAEEVYAPQYDIVGTVRDPHLKSVRLARDGVWSPGDVAVNGAEFSRTVTLEPGKNHFLVVAEDQAENVRETSVTVHYEPAGPLLAVPPAPPSNLVGVLTESVVRLGWRAPRLMADRSGVPGGVPVRYRVHRNGLPHETVDGLGFEDTLPSFGRYTYTVTALMEDRSARVWASSDSEPVVFSHEPPAPGRAMGLSFPQSVDAGGRARLPKAALSWSEGRVVAHMVYVLRGEGESGDRIQYLRNEEGGQEGSWTVPITLHRGAKGVFISDLAVSGEGTQLSAAWIAQDSTVEPAKSQVVVMRGVQTAFRRQALQTSEEAPTHPTNHADRNRVGCRRLLPRSLPIRPDGARSEVNSAHPWTLAYDNQGGSFGCHASEPRSTKVVRAGPHWKRGLDLAYDASGDLHLVWGESNKVYYLRNLEGSPSSVFDIPRRRAVTGSVKSLVQYAPLQGLGCTCEGCWCEESYPGSEVLDAATGQAMGGYREWVEARMVREPSLHVDGDRIVVAARQVSSWNPDPVPNPNWAAMETDPIYSDTVLDGLRPTRMLVGWRKTWKPKEVPGDQALWDSLGVQYQFRYAGTEDPVDRIVVAARPTLGPEPKGPWVDGVRRDWLWSTVDVLREAGLDGAPSHPQVFAGPDDRLHVVYERGPLV